MEENIKLSYEVLEGLGFEYVEDYNESNYWYHKESDTAICAAHRKIIGTNIFVSTLADLNSNTEFNFCLKITDL